MQLILCKDNANREENEMNSFISYPEMQLILCKDKQNSITNKFSIKLVAILYIQTSKLLLNTFKKSKRTLQNFIAIEHH